MSVLLNKDLEHTEACYTNAVFLLCVLMGRDSNGMQKHDDKYLSDFVKQKWKQWG